jgi:hypothetical protein
VAIDFGLFFLVAEPENLISDGVVGIYPLSMAYRL